MLDMESITAVRIRCSVSIGAEVGAYSGDKRNTISVSKDSDFSAITFDPNPLSAASDRTSSRPVTVEISR
jgi:hypothetical protein